MHFNKRDSEGLASYCYHESLSDFYKANCSLGLVLKRQKVLPFYGIPQKLPLQFIHSHSHSLSASPCPSPSRSLLTSPLPPFIFPIFLHPLSSSFLLTVPMIIQAHTWKNSLLRMACYLPHCDPLSPKFHALFLAGILKLWWHKPHHVDVAVWPNTSVNVTEVSALYIITAVHFSALTVMFIPGKD